MASSVSAPVVVPQATKRPHSEIAASEATNPPNPLVSPVPSEVAQSDTKVSESNPQEGCATVNISDAAQKVEVSSKTTNATNSDQGVKHSPESKGKKTDLDNGHTTANGDKSLVDESPAVSDGSTCENGTAKQDPEIESDKKVQVPTSIALAPTSQPLAVANSEITKSTPEPMETSVATAACDTTRPASGASAEAKHTNDSEVKPNTSNSHLEDGEEPEKKPRLSPPSGSSKGPGKTPEQILEHMDKTFEQRRKIITKQMPTIPELKKQYPDLFMGKQLLIEFQRITKIDIDQKIQEFCVRYATAVIEMARNIKGAAPVLARWEQAKQENDTLKQYWDMVTALCLLPLHFGENFVEMVLEIGEDEEVVAQGKIVPTLVARGNIFRTDEFFLIAENTIVQEFEEFTIAFASLYSSYWVFNMMYPETIENTYNYIQRCIVRQREPGSIPAVCKNFTKALQKWNKSKEGK
ncbi:uncharacterized protein LOC131944636 [Physella acuta]|uniref:uncharacterized protein LOC131944636 n=1 Tax=Physella acuta TaxID=109671 RepID=UPI0027DB13B2|nr:uncharacterized protein LOC131944636 [Physella acuta]XP_059161348.1 uncharacterized protein LOC131944636 [Physella acuta]